MMSFLTDKSPENLKRLGAGFMFGGIALVLISRRFEDDATAIAVLLPSIVLLMSAIACLARSATAPSEAAE